MLALRRVFFDGAGCPELVLLHYTAHPEGSPERVVARASLVVPPSSERGKRETCLFLPEPPPGARLRVRYFFSSVGGGAEWFSPVHEATVPGEEVSGDLSLVEEEGSGNLPPAAGLGRFRIRLPLRNEEFRTGKVRFGFGAMRKKPSAELCRAGIAMGGSAPVVEVPEALSVLKNRPMPFFLYHLAAGAREPVAHKINCARITLRDERGDVAFARLLWSDRSWTAQNLSVMEVKNFLPSEGRASDYYFADDREAFLKVRSQAVGRHPLPRTFEAFVFGPAGSVVEYCFHVLQSRVDGSVAAAWRNRDGGNWSVTL
jgi:hypothetical protein